MKKNTLIAIGILGALSVVLLILLKSPSREAEKPSWTVPPLAAVTKVEITDSGSTIVLEKSGEAWRVKQPVDAEVAEVAAKNLNDLLKKGFGADQSLAATDLDKYELGASAPSLAFYAGAEKLVAFTVGKESVVKETYVKRTWVKPEGQEQLFRVQAGLKTDLVKKLDDWREKRITNFEEADMTGMEIAYADKKLVFVRGEDGEWSMTEPAGIALDGAAVKRLASGAGRIRVATFADGKKPAETGLATPNTTLTFKLKDKEPVVLMLGGEAPVEASTPESAPAQPDRYIKLGSSELIYVVKQFTYDSFDMQLGDLRNKEMLTLDLKEVARVTFPPEAAGGKPIVIARDGEAWKMESPEARPLNTTTVEGALRGVIKLRAKEIVDTDAAAAGLAEADAPPRIELALQGGGTTTLFVGKNTGADGKERFVRVGADGLIFSLASWSAEKLLPKVADLTQEGGQGGE